MLRPRAAWLFRGGRFGKTGLLVGLRPASGLEAIPWTAGIYFPTFPARLRGTPPLPARRSGRSHFSFRIFGRGGSTGFAKCRILQGNRLFAALLSTSPTRPNAIGSEPARRVRRRPRRESLCRTGPHLLPHLLRRPRWRRGYSGRSYPTSSYPLSGRPTSTGQSPEGRRPVARRRTGRRSIDQRSIGWFGLIPWTFPA